MITLATIGILTAGAVIAETVHQAFQDAPPRPRVKALPRDGRRRMGLRLRRRPREQAPADAPHTANEAEPRADLNIRLTGSALALAAVSPVFPPALYPSMGLTIYTMLPLLRDGTAHLIKHRKPGTDYVSVGTVYLAYGAGSPVTASMMMLMNSITRKLVLMTQDKAKRGMLDAFASQPKHAWVLRGAPRCGCRWRALPPASASSCAPASRCRWTAPSP